MSNYYLAQIGTTLNSVTDTGTVAPLTLPAGVTLSLEADRRPKFAVLGGHTFMVNSPTRNLWIDNDDRTVRPMSIQPPSNAPVLTAVGTGVLSGTFKVRVTFGYKNVLGDVLMESPFGPISEASPTLTNKYLKATGVAVSTDPHVNFRRLYRTLTGPGAVFFPWVDLDGNTTTTVQDDLPDVLMESVAAPTTLGNPPGTIGSTRLLLIAQWRGRLWGVPSDQPDDVVYSEEGQFGQWAENRLTIPPKGFDLRGVTGFGARREALGVGKTNAFFQITGNTNDNFRVIKLSENVGIEGDESMVIFRDTAYWLWKDGCYKWDNEGIQSITDKQVRNWFNSDTYFNRAMFRYAFATVDPVKAKYRLHLALAGSSTINSWVEFDFNDQTWWGPHITGELTPTSAALLYDANDLAIPVMGSSVGFIYKDQALRTDGAAAGIAFDVDTKFHDCQTPDIFKFFGMLSLHNRVQAAGTLTITPTVGMLGASAGAAISALMTQGRSRLRRLGVGNFVKLNFTHATAAQDAEIYGYQIPFNEVGRR